MSKLRQVRKALQENPNIVIIGAPEEDHLTSNNPWGHTVNFYVAPKIGGIYTAKKLQALMMSLVPGLEPNTKDDFSESDYEMGFGKLYFDEDIGVKVERYEITLTDDDMLSSHGFDKGKLVIGRTYKIQRRTWVSLFPNAQIAAAALKGENEYHITKNELTKYREIAARLAKPFSS